MTQYLVAIYRPEKYDPAVSEDEAMGREIDALNEEMQAAGVRVFAGGSAGKQREVTAIAACRQGAHHRRAVRGDQGTHRRLWVLEATDLDEALAWGRKAAVACRASVEVRPFH